MVNYIPPETFCAIVNDMEFCSEDEIIKRYSISTTSEVLKKVIDCIKSSEVTMLRTKVKEKEGESLLDDKEQDLKDLRRINGINGRGAGSQLERNLESLLDPH